MASNCVQYVTLDFNCGFARTAVRQLTPKIHGTKIFDKQKWAEEFKQLFSACPEYGFPDSYFDDDSNAHGSLFNRDCDKILKIWSKRWNPTESRQHMNKCFLSKNGEHKSASSYTSQVQSLSGSALWSTCISSRHVFRKATNDNKYRRVAKPRYKAWNHQNLSRGQYSI